MEFAEKVCLTRIGNRKSIWSGLRGVPRIIFENIDALRLILSMISVVHSMHLVL